MRFSFLAPLLAVSLWSAAPPSARADAEVLPGTSGGQVFGVRTGMALGAARVAVEDVEWEYEPRFMVDFSAACATRALETLFCALVYERDTLFEPDEIVALVVMSPALTTPDGVHVGMSLFEVEQIWGDARLGFSWANEAREFIDFADAPTGISVRAESPSQGPFGMHVGLYPEETRDAEAQETTVFRSDAVVSSLWLN